MAQKFVPVDKVSSGLESISLDERMENSKFLGRKLRDIDEGRMNLYSSDLVNAAQSSGFKIELTHFGLSSALGRPLRSGYERSLRTLMQFIQNQGCVNYDLLTKSPWPRSMVESTYQDAVTSSVWSMVKGALKWWIRQPSALAMFPDQQFDVDMTKTGIHVDFNESGQSIPKRLFVILSLQSIDGRRDFLMRMKLTKRIDPPSLKELASRNVYRALEDRATTEEEDVTFDSFRRVRDIIVDKHLPQLELPTSLKDCVQGAVFAASNVMLRLKIDGLIKSE